MSPALPIAALLNSAEGPGATSSQPTQLGRVAQGKLVARLLESYLSVVWRTVRRCGVPASLADDATQEVFIVAAGKLDSIVAGREKHFLCGIAVRVAANWRRSIKARHEGASARPLHELASSQPGPAELLQRKRLREAMEQLLEGMPEELRTAFVLFELEGFTVPEVAEVLEVPLGTAASRLRRARAAFRSAAGQLREGFVEGREP
jgi:RNA polymerase sigma-70 factor (ECF subfamily)